MTKTSRVFYSPSHGGFFSPAVHARMPDDAVSITPARHAALLAGQADGHEIVADRQGRPQLRSLAPETIEAVQGACAHAIKREAARRIERRLPLWRQVNALRDGKDPGFHEIDAIRSASNLIEEQMRKVSDPALVASFPVIDNPLWPVFEAGDQTHA